MGRKAATLAYRKREANKKGEENVQRAVAEYRLILTATPNSPPSYRSLALKYGIDAKTLSGRINGRPSIAEFNASKRFLTGAEERVLLEDLKLHAQRGFPLTNSILKENMEAIIHLRKGQDFSAGISFVSRFIERWSDELSVYWLNPLDRSRASGLNPTAVGHYFDFLEHLDQTCDIPAENKYAIDETGFQLGITATVQVIGPAGQKMQHKQRDGNRENVTIAECICADGSRLDPLAIFKGKNLLKKWGKNNPCSASIACSPKGYIDSEISQAWLRHFHQQTKAKNNKPRLLFVDGHASHCGLAFLDYAAHKNIYVVSYPPHTTHALQGLDVVVFAALKCNWQKHRDQWERALGIPLRKQDFLTVYAVVGDDTLTPPLLVEAFRKTGAHPVNRTVITMEQMVPSQETSLMVTFPAILPSPVKAILAANNKTRVQPIPRGITFMSRYESPSSIPANTSIINESAGNPNDFTPSKHIRAMNFLLEKTSVAYLLPTSLQHISMESSTPAPGEELTCLPSAVFEAAPKSIYPNFDLLRKPIPSANATSQTHSINLATEFAKAKAYASVLESILESSNAQLVLTGLEIIRLKKKVVGLEESGRTKNSRAKLMSSGTARHLTGEEFRESLRKDVAAAVVKKKQLAKNGKARQLAKAKKSWQRVDIDSRKEAYAQKMVTWQEECNVAKEKGEKRMPLKPKRQRPTPMPKDSFFEGLEDELSEESDALSGENLSGVEDGSSDED